MFKKLKNILAQDLKQAIVVRTDLKMGKGKIAVQVSHASVAAADKSKYKKAWMGQGMKKAVLKCSGEKELFEIMHFAKDYCLPTILIEDAGHTQVVSGTRTCVGIGPAPVADIDKITGHLKLL